MWEEQSLRAWHRRRRVMTAIGACSGLAMEILHYVRPRRRRTRLAQTRTPPAPTQQNAGRPAKCLPKIFRVSIGRCLWTLASLRPLPPVFYGFYKGYGKGSTIGDLIHRLGLYSGAARICCWFPVLLSSKPEYQMFLPRLGSCSLASSVAYAEESRLKEPESPIPLN